MRARTVLPCGENLIALDRRFSGDIKLGEPADPVLTDKDPPWEQAYYRVNEVPIENPIDSDGDGMNDVYELEAMLDPFNPADASEAVILDGETTTQLEAYSNNYEVGRGRFDVTGVAADGGMMGYADGGQVAAGIHDRQWARAFIVRDRKPPHRRVVYVVVMRMMTMDERYASETVSMPKRCRCLKGLMRNR